MNDPHAFHYDCPECGPRAVIRPGSYRAQTLTCQVCQTRARVSSRRRVGPSHQVDEHGVLTRAWAHTPAPWHVARSARSVNLPGGGKVRLEATANLDVAAHVRLIAMAPSLLNLLERVAYGCGEEFASEVERFLDYIEHGLEATAEGPEVNVHGQGTLGLQST